MLTAYIFPPSNFEELSFYSHFYILHFKTDVDSPLILLKNTHQKLSGKDICCHSKKLELEKSFSPSLEQMLGYFEMCTNQTLISIIKSQKLFLPCMCL